MNDPLSLHILKEGRNYHLQLENHSDGDLHDVEILVIELPSHADRPDIQIRFHKMPVLSAHSTGTIDHHVYVQEDGQWSEAQQNDFHNNEMLGCLTDKYSKGTKYDVDVSWLEGDQPNHQTLRAGAGSGL